MNFYIFNNGIMTEEATSGCEQRVINWLPLFLKQAKGITVITSRQGKIRFEKFKQVKIVQTTGWVRKGLFGLFIGYLVRAIKGCLVGKYILLQRDRKNIIYSASDLIADFIPALFLKLKNKTALFIVGLHLIAPGPWKGFKNYYLKGFSLPTISGIYYFFSQCAILALMKKYADLVLISNHTDKNILMRKGFNENKILVTYGGINLTDIGQAKSESIIYDACYVGRFHSQKGFPDLIDIWAQVIKRYPEAKLAVMGDDINLEAMKEKVRSKGLENKIIFLGFIGGRDKFKLIKSSKVLLVPSYYESFGMVILEALACGVPVVAYNLPVYKKIYTQGIKMVDIGNKGQFTQAVISLLKDEAERTELGRAGWQLSRTFAWEDTANKILSRLTKYGIRTTDDE